MKKVEEKQLKDITKEFTGGIKLFNEKECRQAAKKFAAIIEKYKDSDYYSILEIQARSKVYRNICEARFDPVKIELHDDKDYLYNGIYHLNTGAIDDALERFNYLEKKKFDDPFLYYLLSLVYLKKDNKKACLNYLKTAIDKDEYYKIIAYNEPDFDSLSENEEFSILLNI